MRKNFKKIFAVFFLAFFAIGAMIFLRPQILGFFAITPQEPEPQGQTIVPQKIPFQEKTNETNKQGSVSLDLAYQVIEPTELRAGLFFGKLLPCPIYSEIVFEVKNSGKTSAERLFVKYPSDLVVSNCANCSPKQLSPNETVLVKLNACRALEKKILVEFSSINAQKKSVEIE